MIMDIPPFVYVDGKPFLVVNFDLESRTSDLKAQLDALLDHYSQGPTLLLRPLSPSEAQVLRQACRDSLAEAWAQVVVVEEDRFRPRK